MCGVTLKEHVDAAAELGHAYVPDVFDKCANLVRFHNVVSRTVSAMHHHSLSRESTARTLLIILTLSLLTFFFSVTLAVLAFFVVFYAISQQL